MPADTYSGGDGWSVKIEAETDLTYCLYDRKTRPMFHDRCSTDGGARGVGERWGNPARSGRSGARGGRTKLSLCRAATDRAAEPEFHDGRASPAVLGELLERGLAPAIAVVAVEAERVLARDQVGDGVQVDGVHASSLALGGLTG